MQREGSVTPTEAFLSRLCEKTFLSMWSYPNPFRDQRAAESGDGKELADLLVVFGDDLVIFSDKNVALKEEGDARVNWARWYRDAVAGGAKQLFGAERWLKQFPGKVFLDRACTVPLPVSLPGPERARFHRVVVVHGAADACRRVHGGSGSLMVASEDRGETVGPFTVSPPFPEKGFVHVIDEAVLSELLGNLDTVSDLVAYLRAKEGLFTSGPSVFAAGEEELLGLYLSDIGPCGEHEFVFDGEATHVMVAEGYWERYLRSRERAAKAAADRVSYAWDRLIEKFSFHMRGGTSSYSTSASLAEMERVPRWMARENRTRRRLLARKLVAMAENPRPSGNASFLLPSKPEDPFWVFVVLPEGKSGWDREAYLERRRSLLQAYCYVVKHLHPEARDICGIATNSAHDGGMSEDALYLNASEWSEELERTAKYLHEEGGLFRKVNVSAGTEHEYPVGKLNGKDGAGRVAKVGRNGPCPCGSGKKHKRCCLG